MKFIPHPYQLEAINFMLTQKSSALFLDCGLGKTVITLSVLKILKNRGLLEGRVLIVAPKRPAFTTWPSEIEKWDHTRDLSYSLITGDAEARKNALKKKCDLYIINRENITWLVDLYKERWPFKTVILDELSSFKSIDSKRVRSLIKVRNLVNRITGLTGTPVPNGYIDLWAEYFILDNGKRLGRNITDFETKFFEPDAYGRNWKIKGKREQEQVEDLIRDMTLSQKAIDHLKMPKLVNITDKVYLSSNTEDLYSEFEKKSLLEFTEPDNSNIKVKSQEALIGKLLQFANGAVYDEEGNIRNIHDEKIYALEELLEEQNGKPALVAYWFKFDRQKIIEMLDKNGISWCEIDSTENINRWNNREIAVGLIHPAKAGHGLNIQEGGNTLIWYGLPWSLELYLQTIARIYRQGQTESTCIIHHIITANTIDENVYGCLISKKHIQNALTEAMEKHKTISKTTDV